MITISELKELKNEARKRGDVLEVEAINALLSQADKKRVELKLKTVEEINEEQLILLIKKETKELQEEMKYLEGSNEDLYTKKLIQEGMLLQHLPPEMDEIELESLIRDAEGLTSLNFKEVKDKTLDFYEKNKENYPKRFDIGELVKVIKKLIS